MESTVKVEKYLSPCLPGIGIDNVTFEVAQSLSAQVYV